MYLGNRKLLPDAPSMALEAAQTYCKMKGKSDDKRFCGYVSRVVSEVVAVFVHPAVYQLHPGVWQPFANS